MALVIVTQTVYNCYPYRVLWRRSYFFLQTNTVQCNHSTVTDKYYSTRVRLLDSEKKKKGDDVNYIWNQTQQVRSALASD